MMKYKSILFFVLVLSVFTLVACTADAPKDSSEVTTMKVVGDSKVGFLEIPKDFTKRQDKAKNGMTMTSYESSDKKLALVFMPLDIRESFDDSVKRIKDGYAGNGIKLKESRRKVGGHSIAELKTIDSGMHMNVVIVNGKNSPKIFVFSHDGTKEDQVHQILKTFRE